MAATHGQLQILGPFMNTLLDPPQPYNAVRIFTYDAGTSTLATVYTNPSLTIAATNPLQSDARGLAAFYANKSLRIVVRTSIADGDILLYDWDGVEVWHPDATLRSENRGASYPAATDDTRGRIFGKTDGSGDITEVGINKDGAQYFPITFQNDPLTATFSFAKGADLASASTLTLGSDGNYWDVTGTVTIVAISAKPAGTLICLQFDATPLLTHNGTSLILANNVNYRPAAGSVILFISEGAGNWREIARVAEVIEGETFVNGVLSGTHTGTYTLSGNCTITNPTISGVSTATPGRNILFADSFVKGWLAGAVSGGVPSIDDDLNVSSLTDNGPGDYTINWATAFATAIYPCFGSFQNSTPGSGGVPAVEIHTLATTSARINTWQGSGGGHSVSDYAGKFYVVAMGDQ